MPNCYICQGKGTLKHLERTICKKCFLRTIEKRIKKHLGRNLFKKNDSVLVVGEIELVLLKQAIKNMPLKITVRGKIPKKNKEFDYIIIGKTMDEIDEEFLEGLFKGKLVLGKGNTKLQGKTKETKLFNILEPLTEEEVKLYSKIKKVQFEAKERKNQGKEFLARLKSYKEIKYNIHKNVKELRTLKI